MLRLRLLGGFGAWLGAAEVPEAAYRRPKARSLLKLIALEPDGRLHRDLAMEALWPHLPPEGAANQLHNALSQVRAAFATVGGARARGYLALRGGVLSLGAGGVVVTDVQEFLDLADEANRDGALPGLERVLAAYPGDLLPGDRYEEWAEEPRRALRERCVGLLGLIGESHLEAGRYQEAIRAFEAVLAREASHESAHHGLMRTYGLLGDAARVRRQFEAYRQALDGEIGVPPSSATLRLLETLIEGSGSASRRPPPSFPTPFVGRRLELSAVAAQLADPDVRVLTLVGLGGIGKTRLAVEAAERLSGRFVDGVVYAPLASVGSPLHLVAAISEALGLRFVRAEDELHHHLRDARVLLLLDGADEAVPAAGALARLVDHAAGVKLLVTSRQRLRLRHERVLEVGGLEVPREYASVDPIGFSAVALFVQGARRVHPDAGSLFDLEAVRRICRRLRGVPLAIEIAASWAGTLSCGAIADELERDIDLGLPAHRDVPERHQSLRSAFAYSWALLAEDQRNALASLAVFRGDFSLEAARSVAGVTPGALARLVDRSLVGRSGADRFELHPVLRQFALEELRAGPDEERVLASHAAHFMHRLSTWEQAFAGDAGGEALRALEDDIHDIRAGWAWAADRRRVDLLALALHGAFIYFELRGWAAEGLAALRLASAALTGRGDEALLGRLLAREGALLHRLGEAAEADAILTRSAALLERSGDDRERAFALDTLGVVRHEQDDDGGAWRSLEESLRLRRRLRDEQGEATSLNNLGSLAYATGDHGGAERFFRQSLAIQRRLGSHRAAAISLQNLASIAFTDGHAAAAVAFLEEALALAEGVADATLSPLLLGNLGAVLAALGEHARARSCLARAIAEARELGALSLEHRALLHLVQALREAGDLERAFELCACVLREPSTPHDLQARAARQMEAMAPRLSEAFVRRAVSCTQPAMVEEVIASLQEPRPVDHGMGGA
jgi:predicted ATPase/DNA-binding SARP family transcriptional activator